MNKTEISSNDVSNNDESNTNRNKDKIQNNYAERSQNTKSKQKTVYMV